MYAGTPARTHSPAQRVHAAMAAVGGGGGRSLAERLALADSVRQSAPCDMLVWGLSQDSVAWAGINAGGRTVFLEDVYPPHSEHGMVRACVR